MANIGKTLYSDSPSNGAALIDTHDQAWHSSIESTAEPNLGSPKIRPRSARVGWITFEIPKNARLKEFNLALDSGFSDDIGVWRLR